MRAVDLTGRRYGRLTAVGKINVVSNNNGLLWSCLCDCGNTHKVRSGNLRAGAVRSCGCLAIEEGKRASLAWTKYDSRALGKAYSDLQSLAKRRGKQFNLPYEDYKELIQQDCHYCGAAPPTRGRLRLDGTDLRFRGHTIDRKDNGEGYCRANCVAACRSCNSRKHQKTYDDFRLGVK